MEAQIAGILSQRVKIDSWRSSASGDDGETASGMGVASGVAGGLAAVGVTVEYRRDAFLTRAGVVAGAVAGVGVVHAMARTEKTPIVDDGLDAETMASLRREIRAGFADAFSPLRKLAGEFEQAMRKISATMDRLAERRGLPK
jgi:hypothetical protein